MELSQKSIDRLSTCDDRLQRVFLQVAEIIPCSIIEGNRSKATQTMYYQKGRSKVTWPNSKHNNSPSLAVDASPVDVDKATGKLSIDWKDRERFTLFAGIVLGIARSKGIKLRWGGDWDLDFCVRDNRFDDLVHFELVD